MERCDKHYFDEAVATCGDCGDHLCKYCVVPVKRSHYCVPCALVRSGVKPRGKVAGRTFATSR